jgi:hypothetical protein
MKFNPSPVKYRALNYTLTDMEKVTGAHALLKIKCKNFQC